MPDPILTTLSKLVALYDGVAEATGDRQLTVLLTENIAKQLKLPEEVTLATTADTANSVFVTYHSELLERFTGLLNQRGIVSAIEIAYQGHLKTTGFEKQLLQTLIPQNGLIRYLDAKPAPTRYLWCHVAYTAEADEKRIGMVSFLVNELTMVTPVEIGDALFWEADRLSVTEMAPIPTIHLSCELVRKKHRRVVTAVWNPFTRTIEPLRCEVSGVPVSEFYLDDTSAKIIAPNVWHQTHQ